MNCDEANYESYTVDNALNVIDTLEPCKYISNPMNKPTPKLQSIIDSLQLLKHPEGGYFKETDRSPFTTKNKDGKIRNYSTLIYYLLTPDGPRGRFHYNENRIIHTLHRGRGQYVLIYPDGHVHSFKVGYDVANGEVSQWVVPGGVYKASFVLENDELDDGLLISEVVVPGFDFEDHHFMAGGVEELTRRCKGDSQLANKLSFLL
ncbi:hypothetical protein MOUN0_D00716 [Monosporozyma unispora]|nr:hypothetical protein C6P44_004721 [Kazachstania unispora]